MIAGGLIGYSQQEREAKQVLSEIQDQYFALIESSTDSQGLPKRIEKPINTTPKARGELGEIERFMKEFMNQMMSQRNDYLLEIEAIGWNDILDANRIKADKTFIESKVTIQKAKEIVKKYKEQTNTLFSNTKDNIRSLNISETSKREMLSGFDRGREKSKKNVDALWSLEGKTINEFENIINLLSARKGAWIVEGEQILFYNDSDLERFNYYIASIQKIVAQQEEIQRQSVQTAKRLFLSTEDRGDVTFVEELRKKVKETNNIIKDPQKEGVASYKPSEIFAQNNEAVVLVRSYDGSGNLIGFGSGFNVHEHGVIVTNLHVVLSGGSYLDIKFPKHGTYEDVYIAGFSDFSTDLVVLIIDGKDLPKANISPSVPVNVGDRIYTISNPKGLLNTLSEGLISAKRVAGNTTFYQITAPISEGSSGGAVFNEFGEVIGVASMIMEEGQNLNFAISIGEFSKIEKFEEYFTLKDLMDYLEKQKEENP